MRRRQVLALGAGLVAMAAGCGGATGTRGPATTRISMVVPGPAGGDADRVARSLKGVAERESLARAVHVETRPLASCLAEFTRAPRADQVLMAEPELVGTVRAARPSGAFAGTTPVARLCGEWELIAVPASSRLATFGAFADALRRDPGRLAVAGRNEGGVDHLLLGMLAQSLGVDARLVRYAAHPTCDDAVAALNGGGAAAVIAGQAAVRARVRSGELRVLAVSSPERIPGLEAPTLLESDVHLYCANWRGLLGPGRLADDDRAALALLCRDVAESPRWQALCGRNGWTPLYLDGEDFRQWLGVESARLGRALGELGVRA
ncbi:C4-dicarboxylate ABC transporter substrate-binding protein [Sphaerisporangium krabiense]|uniref:Putative tricarboxylic transport membrane protein n=1 Tax=Sphaerisporangium krabiense TaxID=763782 RepID=A0A7W8ZB28_9ACTN|nr:tripartite tricarboxylate transporter substrate-binding protein [Sphaerisporangium krabiense]MBB5630738.1 putative tricarboxylic transport membrane protein [Sphaerisporangium krabiense]GII65581.1 C4-dicarboxylate ABC transporter substrate-binding protein [Sphaerisporangium krabiense]